MKNKTHLKTWLTNHERNASWLGRQLDLGRSQSCDIVAGRKQPSMAQKLAIELVTEGAVARDLWP